MSSLGGKPLFYIVVDGEKLFVEDGRIGDEPVTFYEEVDNATIATRLRRKRKRRQEGDEASKSVRSATVEDSSPGASSAKENGHSRRSSIENGSKSNSNGTGDLQIALEENGNDNEPNAVSHSSPRLRSDEVDLTKSSASEKTTVDDSDSSSCVMPPRPPPTRNGTSIPSSDREIQFRIDYPTLEAIKKWSSKNGNHFSAKFHYRDAEKQFLHVLYALNPQVVLDRELRAAAAASKGVEGDGDEADKSVCETIALESEDEEAEQRKSYDILCNIPLLSSREKTEHLRSKNKSFLKPSSPYSPEEDRAIINWVLRKNNVLLVNGASIWRDLEISTSLPYVRTWQSLRNRFLKSILYNLRQYGLSSEEEKRIVVGAEKGTLKKSFANSSRYANSRAPRSDVFPKPRETSKEKPKYAPSIQLEDLSKRRESYKMFKSKVVQKKNSHPTDDLFLNNKRKLFTQYSFVGSETSRSSNV